MAIKIKDLVVKTGTYFINGDKKSRYENVGAVMQGDDGGEFMLLKRTFNPAGVPNPESRDVVTLYAYSAKPNQARPPVGEYGAPDMQDSDVGVPF